MTDAVTEGVRAWQFRGPWMRVYSDCVSGRAGGEDAAATGAWKTVPCMLPSASTMEGRKEVLGLWTSAHEGAKFSLQVLTAGFPNVDLTVRVCDNPRRNGVHGHGRLWSK